MSWFRIISIVILLVVVGCFFVWMKAPHLIARSLSGTMGVEVQIKEIDLSMNKIKVEGIEIANPQGSFLPKAFSAGAITVSAPLTHYLDKDIVIEAIELHDIYVSLEFMSPAKPVGNWSAIFENMTKETAPAPTPAPEKEEKAPSLLIKQLVLTNMNADLVYKLQGNEVKKLPVIERIVLTNISSKDGIGIDQIAKVILEKSINAILEKENLPGLIEGVLTNPKGTLDSLKEFFSK